MSTGHALFYAGAAILALAVLLLFFFLIKKPKYEPENSNYSGEYLDNTQILGNKLPLGDLEETRIISPYKEKADLLSKDSSNSADDITDLLL